MRFINVTYSIGFGVGADDSVEATTLGIKQHKSTVTVSMQR
jgi:hypothetical protein